MNALTVFTWSLAGAQERGAVISYSMWPEPETLFGIPMTIETLEYILPCQASDKQRDEILSLKEGTSSQHPPNGKQVDMINMFYKYCSSCENHTDA